MPRQSAGILLYRKKDELEVFLVHPGGPLFAKKDAGAWSVPKGEYVAGEDALEAAKREFEEETGQPIQGTFIPLFPIKQKSGKVVNAWAVEGDIDPAIVSSNTFEMIWPPRSEKMKTFPEIDRAEWFSLEVARLKINERQVAFLDELESYCKSMPPLQG